MQTNVNTNKLNYINKLGTQLLSVWKRAPQLQNAKRLGVKKQLKNITIKNKTCLHTRSNFLQYV